MDAILIHPIHWRMRVAGLFLAAIGIWGALFYFGIVNSMPRFLCYVSPFLSVLSVYAIAWSFLSSQPLIEIKAEGVIFRYLLARPLCLRWIEINRFEIVRAEIAPLIAVVPTKEYLARSGLWTNLWVKLHRVTMGSPCYVAVSPLMLPGSIKELLELLRFKHRQFTGMEQPAEEQLFTPPSDSK